MAQFTEGNLALSGDRSPAAAPFDATACLGADQAWGVVLAGGEGVRLRPLIRRLHGEDRPKQFARLLGSRSLLRQTLDRIDPLISADRTVVVVHQSHERYLAEALDGARVGRVLMQPEDRGTAAGVLLPTQWIHRQDPEAIVAVFPSDHFVGDEYRFVEHVANAVEAVRQHPEWLVLLGAVPTDADPDYGWIEPGEPVDWSAGGGAVSRVRRFWEKPSSMAAHACLEQGWLWNTFVFVAKASRLLDLSSRLTPRLHEALSLIWPFWETDQERWALEQAFAQAPKANFSRSVLELAPPELVVSRLSSLVWSDWGRPERVIRSLRTARLLPAWFEESDLRPETGLPAADVA